MSGSDAFAPLMEPVARLLLGEPNARLSNGREIRFGSRGSLSIDRHRGVFHDHERDMGGGVLDLIRDKRGLTGRDAIAWLGEQGLALEKSPQASFGANNRQPQRGRIVDTYDYWSEDGILCFQTIRYEPKDFRQRRPDPEKPGQWIWNLKGAKLVPFNLPAVIEAVRAGVTVFVSEGEKAVIALSEIGAVATCSPMGACKWRSEFVAYLQDANVVILPDNDEPGRRHSGQVLASLQGVAAQVRIVELPGLPEKGDPFDWVAAGGTAEQLAALVEAAGKPALKPELDVKAAAESKPAIKSVGTERLPLFPPLKPATPYPVEALGPVLAPAVDAIARKVQAPIAIAAQSVLAAASLAAQSHADVRLPYGQTRPLGLYLITVAFSGDRKSTSDNEALRPIAHREDELQRIHSRAHQDWLVEFAAWSAERKKIEADRKLGFEDRKVLLKDLGPEPLQPIRPMLTTSEPTFEGLVKNWPNLHPSLGLFASEGGGFVAGHGMAAENRLRTAAGFSLLWDGAPITRVRALDGVSILKGRRLSLHLMVQPDAATAFLSDPVLRDQGLLSRILVAMPDSIAGTRLYRATDEEDEALIRRYHGHLLALFEARCPVSEDRSQGLMPRQVVFSVGAEARWRDLYNWIEERCGLGGDLHAIRDLAAKSAEHAARIAGVLTVVADQHAAEIGTETMENATRLISWYLDEALRLHGASRIDPKLVHAQKLLSWMQDQPDGRCQLRDVLRLGPNPTRTKKDAEAALDILVAHGWVEQINDRPRAFQAYADGAAHG